MERSKPKILVLSELNDSVNTTLKSAISLANMTQGSLSLFCVKKPTDVVTKENQLSAIREINKEYTTANNTIKKLLKTLTETFHIPIDFSFSVGALKQEIKNYLKAHNPDIIVIGKRKSKLLNLTGDKVTEFILKQHQGPILVVDTQTPMLPNEPIILGFFNRNEDRKRNLTELVLQNHSEKPIKSFKIVNKFDKLSESVNSDVVEFIFEQSDDSLNTLSNYLLKSNVTLLMINRNENNVNGKSASHQDISELANKLNVSLFIS
ncbi:universal stress protein [Aestuariibaculum sediminum]|uniref:Universal stress protein n=1 Tax=Aestuariibaculum sediminum TaxID=2770637 RepID=A0A8J6PZ04_9FLAO|nr:universal stress protein [Aestuariibaculum sediminum]MBD0831458.1 universal stress protein [Aestuariibaculum sediminum]